MPRNEEGEFELVLGNKQLLSVFFIVIILMGVCFAMGYIIGRNSTPPGTETVARNHKEGPPIVVDPNASTPAPGASTPSNIAPGQVSLGPESAAQAPVVQPKPAPTTEEPPKQAPPETKAETKKPEPPPAPTPAATSNRVVEPTAGQTFLQVLAVGRPDAELTVETLGKKGFHAIIAPGPSDKLFRVLVGPLKDQPEIAKTRTGLEAVGFRSPIVRKY